jgi:hypothetical protein
MKELEQLLFSHVIPIDFQKINFLKSKNSFEDILICREKALKGVHE